jgi:hypothetical protein
MRPETILDAEYNSYLKWIERHLSIARKISIEDKLNLNSDFDVVLLCFLNKQLDHLDAIYKIQPNNDIMTLARNMIEGYIYLSWIQEKPKKRAKKWREYLYIDEWFKVKKLISRGYNISAGDDIFLQIKNDFLEFGRQFLIKKHKDTKTPLDQLPEDFFQKSFLCGKTYAEIAKEVSNRDEFLKNQYENIYSLFSKWTHWAPQGLYGTVKLHKTTEIKYKSYNESAAGHALLCSLYCFNKVISEANKYFNLGLEGELQSLQYEFIVEIGAYNQNHEKKYNVSLTKSNS